ncbi:small ribosomal subunit protein mS26-like [Ornithodoros turicata]|uniref:Small ribosomal subunit protein mS26 n=1 Tax=Ornithodoros turicata TaxID=34597 RepID=A0A2R5LHJ6_9ACAR
MLGSLVMKLSRLSVADATYGYVLRPVPQIAGGLQQQRWKVSRRRKPRWMPIAPSKLFNIIERKPRDPEETQQLDHLYRMYKTEIKSIINYFVGEHKKSIEAADKYSAISIEEVKEQERLLEENEKENQRVAKLRAEWRKKLMEERVEELLKIEADAKREMEERKKQIEEIVRREKEQSATYVTLEKLQDAIEFAVENPVSYNFAIDLEGNVLWEGTPHMQVQFLKPKQESSAEA